MHKYKTTTWERLRKRCNHGYRIESSHPLMVSFHLYKRWDWVNCVLCGRPCELQAETAEFWTETEFTKEVLYFDQFDLAFWLNFWLLWPNSPEELREVWPCFPWDLRSFYPSELKDCGEDGHSKRCQLCPGVGPDSKPIFRLSGQTITFIYIYNI